MPKVTDAHIEARRNQIIEAACKCFSINGFHQTTIRDICRQADLSAGAVYGYFRSKEEIIEALGALGRQNTRALLESARTAEEAPLSLAQVLNVAIGFLNSDDAEMNNRLGVRLWGEALHTPQIRRLLFERFHGVSELVAEIVREGQERKEIDAELDPDSAARVCVALFLGLQVQKALEPRADLAGCSEVISSLLSGEFRTET
jgi:AcrR family transcriptional regulator